MSVNAERDNYGIYVPSWITLNALEIGFQSEGVEYSQKENSVEFEGKRNMNVCARWMYHD